MNHPKTSEKEETPDEKPEEQGKGFKQKLKGILSSTKNTIKGDSPKERSNTFGSEISGQDNKFSKNDKQGNPQISSNSHQFKSNQDNLQEKEFQKDDSENEIEMVDSTPELYDEINQVRQEYRQALDSEKELLQEEIEEAVEDLQDELEAQRDTMEQKMNSLRENTETELNSLKEEVESVAQRVEDLEEELGQKAEPDDHQTVAEEVDDVREEVLDLRDDVDVIQDQLVTTRKEVSTKADYSTAQEVEEIRDAMEDKLEYEGEEAGVSVSSQNVGEQLEKLQDRVEKLGANEESRDFTPADIDRDLLGKEIQVSGVLQLNKQVEGNYLYTLEGSEGEVVVRSKRQLDEGETTVHGVIKEMDNIIFVEPLYS